MKPEPSAPVTVSLISERSASSGSASRVLSSAARPITSATITHSTVTDRYSRSSRLGDGCGFPSACPKPYSVATSGIMIISSGPVLTRLWGVRLFESASHVVVFGVSHGNDRAPFTAAGTAALQELLEPLAKAARLHTELGSLGWEPAIALCALDQLAAAVIVTDSDGRVIQANRAAERVLRRGDGLTIRNGKLGALHVFDGERLEAVIAAAAAEQKTGAAIGRMRIRRHDGHPPYILTVAPAGTDVAAYERPLTMIVLADPDENSPSERDLAEFFGLSRAESRLAVALLGGKRLGEVSRDFGVQITTLRTQLSSILKKTEVTRQVDLIRLLSSVPVISAGTPETK